MITLMLLVAQTRAQTLEACRATITFVSTPCAHNSLFMFYLLFFLYLNVFFIFCLLHFALRLYTTNLGIRARATISR